MQKKKGDQPKRKSKKNRGVRVDLEHNIIRRLLSFCYISSTSPPLTWPFRSNHLLYFYIKDSTCITHVRPRHPCIERKNVKLYQGDGEGERFAHP